MTKSSGITKRKGHNRSKVGNEENYSKINTTDGSDADVHCTGDRPIIETDGSSGTNATSQMKPSHEMESSTVIPRGRPKSGRVWKTTRTQSHNDMMRMNTLKTSWNQKMKIRSEAKAIKARERELKEARAKELQMKHARRELNKKRREENQRKAEIVQPIKNTAKIKRMKKKQLRMIAKR